MEYPKFKVCVRCYTFNHSKYITDAMNGFVMQQTDFPYVCCIVDDASKDGEQDVIRKYVSDNFDLSEGSCHFERETDYAFITYAQHKTNKNCYFAVLYLKENHYSIKKPKMPYLTEWQDGCEYHALCEGDDYWIHPGKLQMQVAFLDSHPDYVLSHSDFQDQFDWNGELKYNPINRERIERCPEDSYAIRDRILDSNYYLIQTMTAVYRNHLDFSRFTELKQYDGKFLLGDTVLWLKLSVFGKFHYVNEITSVYRHHLGSACNKESEKDKWRFHLSVCEFQSIYADYFNQSQKLKNKINKNFLFTALYYHSLDKDYVPIESLSFQQGSSHKLYVFFLKTGLSKLVYMFSPVFIRLFGVWPSKNLW